MKHLLICLLVITAAYGVQAQERGPAKIMKPMKSPAKLIQVLRAMDEGEEDIKGIIAFYGRHVPGMIEYVNQRITPDVIALAKEADDDDDDDDDEDEDDEEEDDDDDEGEDDFEGEDDGALDFNDDGALGLDAGAGDLIQFDEDDEEDDDDDDDEDDERDEARWREAERILDFIVMMVEDYYDYEELREEEPEHAAKALKVGIAKYQTILLGDQIRQLRRLDDKESEAKITKLETQLRKELGKMFDLKLDQQRKELEWLRKETEEIQRIIKKKEKYRKQLINKKLLELTGIADEMDF